MYTATIDSVRYTFQASGSLWQDALVMQDVETKNLWAQITGESIMGDAKGKKLDLYPHFFHSTFGEFKEKYPNGLLLKKENLGNQSSHYEKYMQDSTKFGIFGRDDTFTKLGGKALIYGVRIDNNIIAVTQNYLADKTYYAFQSGESTIILYYDKESETIRAYNSNFKMQDGNISTKWNYEDLLKFESIPVVTSFWFAWVSFFPETELVQ